MHNIMKLQNNVYDTPQDSFTKYIKGKKNSPIVF